MNTLGDRYFYAPPDHKAHQMVFDFDMTQRVEGFHPRAPIIEIQEEITSHPEWPLIKPELPIIK